jgi:hypothetical protein
VGLTVTYYINCAFWCILRLAYFYTTNYLITLATSYTTKHHPTLSLRPLPLAPSVQAEAPPAVAAPSRPATPVEEPQQQQEAEIDAPEAPPAAVAAVPSPAASPAPEPQQQQDEIQGPAAPPAAATAPSRPASPVAEPQQQDEMDAPAEAAAVCYVSVDSKLKHHVYVEPKTPAEWAALWQKQERNMKIFNNSMRLQGYKW